MRLHLAAVLVALACIAAPSRAAAQEIEPRAYSNAPVDVNFLIAGYAYTSGGVSADPAVPLSQANLETSNLILGYSRVLDLWGMSSKLAVTMPYTWLSGTARLAGEPLSRSVSGNGNLGMRLSVNLYGAPALTLPEFRNYKQDLIVGASLTVYAPVGQYDDTRVVNIGSNRWAFKPELGISKAIGRWTLEATAGVTFFTDNEDFLEGGTRSQDPIYSTQIHVIYGFSNGMWASLDGTYFGGGRTTVNGKVNSDLQQNWRVGGTFAVPINARNSVKFYASSGVSARTNNNFDLMGVAWQYRWGGGI